MSSKTVSVPEEGPLRDACSAAAGEGKRAEACVCVCVCVCVRVFVCVCACVVRFWYVSVWVNEHGFKSMRTQASRARIHVCVLIRATITFSYWALLFSFSAAAPLIFFLAVSCCLHRCAAIRL